MEYKNLQTIDKKEAEKIFSAGEVRSICEALVSVAFYVEDWRWAQNQCLEFLRHKNVNIRGVAATCLGHIGRIHGQLEKEKVLFALRTHLDDASISGQVEDAIDDINNFVS